MKDVAQKFVLAYSEDVAKQEQKVKDYTNSLREFYSEMNSAVFKLAAEYNDEDDKFFETVNSLMETKARNFLTRLVSGLSDLADSVFAPLDRTFKTESQALKEKHKEEMNKFKDMVNGISKPDIMSTPNKGNNDLN